jgi:hypothetical protein
VEKIAVSHPLKLKDRKRSKRKIKNFPIKQDTLLLSGPLKNPCSCLYGRNL